MKRLATATAVGALAGCAHVPWSAGPGASGAPVRPASSQPPADDVELLIAPSPGNASPDDAVVRVVGPQVTCSGVLVAADLVLTAHHCVVERDRRGECTQKLVGADSLDVQLGGDYLAWGSVGLRSILAPSCGEAGGQGDVAVLILERKLTGMTAMGLRPGAPRVGDAVDPVGFGRCLLSPEGIRRRERQGGTISAVYPGTFEAEASVCPGDSGGPVLDRSTREVVGIVSLSAMDHDESTRGRSVFARVDGVPKLIAYARLVANGADPGDLPPLTCDR